MRRARAIRSVSGRVCGNRKLRERARSEFFYSAAWRAARLRVVRKRRDGNRRLRAYEGAKSCKLTRRVASTVNRRTRANDAHAIDCQARATFDFRQLLMGF